MNCILLSNTQTQSMIQSQLFRHSDFGEATKWFSQQNYPTEEQKQSNRFSTVNQYGCHNYTVEPYYEL